MHACQKIVSYMDEMFDYVRVLYEFGCFLDTKEEQNRPLDPCTV